MVDMPNNGSVILRVGDYRHVRTVFLLYYHVQGKLLT